MSNDINIIHNYYNLLVYYVYKYCLFYTCNITLTRRRGSRPDGARYTCYRYYKIILYNTISSDIDECSEGTDGCSEMCVNTQA